MIEYALKDENDNTYSLNGTLVSSALKNSISQGADIFEYDNKIVERSFLYGSDLIGDKRLMAREFTLFLSRAEEAESDYRQYANEILQWLDKTKYLVDVTNSLQIEITVNTSEISYDPGSLKHSSEDHFSFTALKPYWTALTADTLTGTVDADTIEEIAISNSGYLKTAPIITLDNYIWSVEGTEFPITGIDVPALCTLDSTHVAFIDSTLEELRTYVWNGSVWALVGSGFSIPGIFRPAISTLDSTHIAFIDNNLEELRTYVWNGSVWALDGSGLGISEVDRPAIATLDSTHVAMVNAVRFAPPTAPSIRTYVWNGSVWALEGTPFLLPSNTQWPAIAALDSTHIAFIDSIVEELTTYLWNGSIWIQDGLELSIPFLAQPAICAISSSRIALADGGLDKLRLYDFISGIWSLVGDGIDITLNYPALTALDSSNIAFIDDTPTTSEELTTYEIGGYAVDEVQIYLTSNNFGINILDSLFGLAEDPVMEIDCDLGLVSLNNVNRNENIVSGTGFFELPTGGDTINILANGEINYTIEWEKRYYI